MKTNQIMRQGDLYLRGVLALLFVSVMCADRLYAQNPGRQSADKSSTSSDQDEGKETEDSANKEAAKKHVVAITGGDILTVTQGRIRNGTVLIEDDKIVALGHDVDIPEDAEIIDVTGKTVTPGFVALDMANVGLNTQGENSQYQDGLDPFDDNVTLSLSVGITTGCLEIRTSGRRGRRRGSPVAQTFEEQVIVDGKVVTFPDDGFPVTKRFPGLDPDFRQLSEKAEAAERDYGEYVSTCPCCGLPILPTEPITPARPTPITPQKNVVVKMSYGRLKGMLVKENAFLDVTPGALQGAMNQKNWRDQISKARKYLEDQAAHERATAEGKKESPPRKPVSDEMLALVKGEIALRITANTVSEIQSLVELAKELDFRLVVDGANEAWVVPQQLAEASVGVILTPRLRRDPVFGAEDRSGTWIETTRVMEETGVAFAVKTLSNSISLNGLAGRDLTSLPLEAAFAVRGGASERKALEAITIAPARMLGLEDRIGSIEVGKDADLLVLNGNPLDYRTYVETAIVNGHKVYERGVARVLPVYDR